MKPTVPDRAELRSRRLWFAALTLLSQAEKEFLSQWGKAARSFGEEEVHDLRVASRRLREGLALFAPCFPPKKVARVSKLVKSITRSMGALRNIDEALIFLSALEPEETSGCAVELEELKQALAHEREDARRTLAKELAGPDRSRLRRQFRLLVSRTNTFAGSGVDPFARLSPFAAGALAERADAVRRLLPDAMNEVEFAAQHRLRIAVKKMRYRAELIGPLFPDQGEELRGALKTYQEVLGKLHDLDIFAEMVPERVEDGVGREELLQVMAKRRKDIFGRFVQTLDDLSLEELTERALATL